MKSNVIFYNYNYLVELSSAMGNFQTIAILTKGLEGESYRKEVIKTAKSNVSSYRLYKKVFGKTPCNPDGIKSTIEQIRKMVKDIEERALPAYILKYYTKLVKKINKEIDYLNLKGLDIDHI